MGVLAPIKASGLFVNGFRRGLQRAFFPAGLRRSSSQFVRHDLDSTSVLGLGRTHAKIHGSMVWLGRFRGLPAGIGGPPPVFLLHGDNGFGLWVASWF